MIQLALQRRGFMPSVEVYEELNFKIRGFHLDIARGGVPRVDTFKGIIRWLFLLKYNYFFIYLEDLYPWRSYPDIGVSRGRLTEEEWNSIVNYGELYGIEVVPSLELLGHMENILSLPRYSRFRELWWVPRDGTLDASNEEARAFALRLLQDVLETSRSRLIHIGGDETWSLGRGRSLDRVGFVFKGPELYLTHYRALLDMVKRYGKVPVVWGDMLTGVYLPSEERAMWGNVINDRMWDEVIIANWNYEPLSVGEFRDMISRVGHYNNQLACPGLSNWNRFYPNFERALTNIRNFLTAARESGLGGFLITAWGDDGEECLFTYLTPLILASMEIAEGTGDWEAKWVRLSGEGKDVLKARELFGSSVVADNIKNVVYLDRLSTLSEEVKGTIKDAWGKILNEVSGVKLPEDLELIRRMIEVGLRAINGEAREDDYWSLIETYAKLWLSERKPEGLANVLSRFAKSLLMLRYGLRY
jgi:N-acetyl-beta-hexosaminidase